jgi:hypothetical protein
MKKERKKKKNRKGGLEKSASKRASVEQETAGVFRNS